MACSTRPLIEPPVCLWGCDSVLCIVSWSTYAWLVFSQYMYCYKAIQRLFSSRIRTFYNDWIAVWVTCRNAARYEDICALLLLYLTCKQCSVILRCSQYLRSCAIDCVEALVWSTYAQHFQTVLSKASTHSHKSACLPTMVTKGLP